MGDGGAEVIDLISSANGECVVRNRKSRICFRARFGNVDVWKHQVTLYLRAPESFDGDPPTAYYRLFRLITKGVPVSAGAPMLNVTVHPSCYPMDLPPIQRQTDAEGLDYFEVPLTFTEMGDE